MLPKCRSAGRPWADDRRVLEGILWVLKTGARWRDLPSCYPSASTYCRRLRLWEEDEVWLDIWRAFLRQLDAQGGCNGRNVLRTAVLLRPKKGATPSAKPSAARARSGWWWSTVRVFLWVAHSTAPTRRNQPWWKARWQPSKCRVNMVGVRVRNLST